jgi:hypothetical protein
LFKPRFFKPAVAEPIGLRNKFIPSWRDFLLRLIRQLKYRDLSPTMRPTAAIQENSFPLTMDKQAGCLARGSGASRNRTTYKSTASSKRKKVGHYSA